MKITIFSVGSIAILLSILACNTPPKPPTGPDPNQPHHSVVAEKELFITHPNVVNAANGSRRNAWHIRNVLQRIAGQEVNVDRFAEDWFKLWDDVREVAGSTEPVKSRPNVARQLRDAWKNDRIRLIAIVSRMDLARFPQADRNQPPETLGEGRFIYEVTDPSGNPLRCTIIFEFALPIHGPDSRAALREWAQRWHALGRPELGNPSEFPVAYLDELQSITDDFSAHGNLNQIRSNELLDFADGEWELREFHFSKQTTRLTQVPVNITPPRASNGSRALGDLVNMNAGNLVAGLPIRLPENLQGAVSLVPSPMFEWEIPSNELRPTFIFAFNTCSGCHAGTTQTPFQHIGVSVNSTSRVSKFLREAIPIAAPLPPRDNTELTHNEMEERMEVLAEFAVDQPPGRSRALVEKSVSRILKSRINRPH